MTELPSLSDISEAKDYFRVDDFLEDAEDDLKELTKVAEDSRYIFQCKIMLLHPHQSKNRTTLN